MARRGRIRGVRRSTIPCLLALLTLAAAGATARATTAERSGNPPMRINPIAAVFIPAKRETEYKARWYDAVGRVTITWELHLELVDPQGTKDPATPDSAAAVDLACDNAGVGLPNNPDTHTVPETSFPPEFIWHHPDPADSVPPGKYACNHLDQGPHGHQGLITVQISDKEWTCTASYKGTRSSGEDDELPTPEQVQSKVENGTATAPKCRRR